MTWGDTLQPCLTGTVEQQGLPSDFCWRAWSNTTLTSFVLEAFFLKPYVCQSLKYYIFTGFLLQGNVFKKDVFEKVERPYMLGLRSINAATRRKFFDLYNDSIPASLFERLKFILCEQDWENLSSSFWLKEALVTCPLNSLLYHSFCKVPSSWEVPCSSQVRKPLHN